MSLSDPARILILFFLFPNLIPSPSFIPNPPNIHLSLLLYNLLFPSPPKYPPTTSFTDYLVFLLLYPSQIILYCYPASRYVFLSISSARQDATPCLGRKTTTTETNILFHHVACQIKINEEIGQIYQVKPTLYQILVHQWLSV